MAPNPGSNLTAVIGLLALAAVACSPSPTDEAEAAVATTTTTSTPSTLPTTTTVPPTPTTAATTTTTQPPPPPPCVVTAPPAETALDPFYEKFCEVLDIPVLASGEVPDDALLAAAEHAQGMIEHEPQLAAEMRSHGIRIAIISADQVTTDIPEHANLYEQFPGTDWDGRTRGVGATTFIPVSTVAEENLLCYQDDSYLGEDLFVQLFAHSVRNLGIAFLDPTADRAIEAAYGQAIAAGLWEDTFAAINSSQYWAEGVQSYFNTNLEADPPDGVHNQVNTREELREYDPTLFGLIDAVFAGSAWLPSCPS